MPIEVEKNYDYIWLDANIYNEENSEYSKDLVKNYPKIALFANINDALKFLKQIKFHITFIIVSGSLFHEFIIKLKGMIFEISSVPKIIIFTSENTKKEIKDMPIINDSFYNNGGIALSFEEVQSFLKNNIITEKLIFDRPLRREISETELNFLSN